MDQKEECMRIATTEVVVRARGRMCWVDLTGDLRRAVESSGVTRGTALAYCTHTTSALMINELEDGALHDLHARLDELVPADAYYAHDDFGRRTQNLQPEERVNGRSHVMQMVLGGTSQAVPVDAGEPMLGRWQRLMMLELDEPKDRTLTFQVWGL
jgi:secondary thiamine-phosphate synthase enzyme